MTRHWSLGDVMLGAIGSTLLYVPLVMVAWGFGICIGAAIHSAQWPSMSDWLFLPLTAWAALILLPLVHHWLLIFWFTVPLTAVRGLYLETPLARGAIFIALAVQGAVFGWCVS